MAQRNTYATELTVTSTLNAEVSDFVPGDQGPVIAPASDREVAQDGYSPGLYNNPPSITVQRTLSTRRDSAASIITNPFETDENEYYGPQLLLDEVPCRINSVGDREYFINYQGIKATAFESSHQEQLYPPTHRTDNHGRYREPVRRQQTHMETQASNSGLKALPYQFPDYRWQNQGNPVSTVVHPSSCNLEPRCFEFIGDDEACNSLPQKLPRLRLPTRRVTGAKSTLDKYNSSQYTHSTQKVPPDMSMEPPSGSANHIFITPALISPQTAGLKTWPETQTHNVNMKRTQIDLEPNHFQILSSREEHPSRELFERSVPVGPPTRGSSRYGTIGQKYDYLSNARGGIEVGNNGYTDYSELPFYSSISRQRQMSYESGSSYDQLFISSVASLSSLSYTTPASSQDVSPAPSPAGLIELQHCDIVHQPLD